MRRFFVLLALLPSTASAWSLAIADPTDEGMPCVRYMAHEIAIAADGTSTEDLEIYVDEATQLRLWMPRDSEGEVSASLDGEALNVSTAAAEDADRLIETMARHNPALLSAGGRAASWAWLRLEPGSHRVHVESQAQVTPGAPASLHFGVRKLGTACSPPPTTIRLELETEAPIAALFAPYHALQTQRHSATSASIEAHCGPGHDFELLIVEGEGTVEGDLLGWREDACGDAGQGYAMALAGPTVVEQGDSRAKDVVLVIDTSGSMSGTKLQQAQRALLGIVEGLGPEDSFEIVSFNDEPRPFRGSLGRPAFREVAGYVNGLRADGATNISGALSTGLDLLHARAGERPRMVIFLTDGIATAGETDNARIVERVDALNTRIFAFGVGNDVNTWLLDELGRRSGGRLTTCGRGRTSRRR